MADICAVQNKRPHLTKEERFPRCYKDVSKVLKTVKSCKGNLKTVLYNSKLRGAYLKKIQGLASNILKNYRTVAKVTERVGLLEKEPLLQLESVEVMVYELILGTGTLIGHSKPIETVNKYHREILDAFQEIQSESTSDSGSHSLPRYARVNALVTTIDEVSEELRRLGYEEVQYGDSLSQEQYLELIRGLRSPQFLLDYHFPDVLVFPAGENLCWLKMYQKGKILLQDKSSYIPVKVLDPEPGSMVLDACAAPGMKTIHIASMMQHQGVLLAYEKDAERFATLQKMIHQYDIQTCQTFNQDFRSTDPSDDRHSKIRYILLDPSCSGSGMVNRMDSVTDRPDSKSESRLQKLAGFQIVLLKHALKFPNVQRVVYSTCSIHEEENEFVVHEALGAFRDRFRLVPVLPEWPTRGSGKYEFGELCLRSYPEQNATNGFFVAAFERVEGHSAEKGRRNKKHRSESLAEPMDGVSNSNYRDNVIRDDYHKSQKRETAEQENEDMQNYLEPDASGCEGKETSKRNKKKHRSDSRVDANEQDLMGNGPHSDFQDTSDNSYKSHKRKKHKTAEHQNEGIQDHSDPDALDCEDEELSKSKRKKKKHRLEMAVDGNEYSYATEKESFLNPSYEDGGIDEDCFKSQKRKKHKKNRQENGGDHSELLDCDHKETSLDVKKEKKVRRTNDIDGKGNGSMSAGDLLFREKEENKFTKMIPSQTESPDPEHSFKKKKKKHKTKHHEKELLGRNELSDSTSTLTSIQEGIGGAEDQDLDEHTRKQAEDSCGQFQIDDESVACPAGDSKKKKKRKKHEVDTDASIVLQEHQSNDLEVAGTSFKRHKKHKKDP